MNETCIAVAFHYYDFRFIFYLQAQHLNQVMQDHQIKTQQPIFQHLHFCVCYGKQYL